MKSHVCLAAFAAFGVACSGSDDLTGSVDEGLRHGRSGAESANCTTLTSAGGGITDASGNTWGLQSSADRGLVVVENGGLAGFTAQVSKLVYVGHAAWQENVVGNWWSWQNGAWTAGADPTGVCASAQPPAPSAVDAGVAPTPTPSAPPSSSTSFPHFYGGNAHWDYSWTSQQIVDHLHQAGMTMLRMNTRGYDSSGIGRVKNFASGIAAIDPKIKVFAVIDNGFDSTASEAANYAAGFAGGKAVASTLGPAGVTDYECGNELLTLPAVFPRPGVPGDKTSDYTPGAGWRAMRGTIRGMIDGVKSVNSSFRTGVNFTIAQVAASDMLWNGTEPDGATGPTVRWDITTWHNYKVYGDLFHIGTEAHGSSFNLIDYIAKAYGKPIMITEWNSNPEDSDATKTTFTKNFLQEVYDNRVKYQIESAMIYQLDGGAPDFGLFVFPQQTAAYAAFSAEHSAL